MAVRSIVVRIGANIDDLRRGLNAGTDLARRQADAMDKVGKQALIMGALMSAGFLVSAKAAIEWETAWAGVTKTVNGSSTEMQQLENQLRSMATSLPVSAKEIAGVAESAGQLGIKRQDIAGFTKTMIDLGVSTNLTADEAATGIAQIGNVLGIHGQDVARFGATLVQLGNNGASTERDILQMAQRIAGAGKLVGASGSDVLALSNALSSMGVQAELGGGVVTRALTGMYSAVTSGGEALQGFADVAGVSTTQFAEDFRGRPIQAFNEFIQGLDRIDKSGGNVVDALNGVGLSGTYNTQVLLQLKGAGDLLSDSLDMGVQAWEANTALVAEANKRYETTASKLEIAKNGINELAIQLGDFLLPAISGAAGGLQDLTGTLSGLPDGVQAAFVILGAIGTAIAVGGGAALIAIPKYLALEGQLVRLGMSAAGASRAMALLNTTVKVGASLVAVAALAAGLAVLVDHAVKGSGSVDQLSQSIIDFQKTGQLSGPLVKGLGADFQNLAKVLDQSGGHKWLDAVVQGAEVWKRPDLEKGVAGAQKTIKNLDGALAGLVQSGNADAASNAFDQLAVAAKEQGVSVDDLKKKFPQYGDALRGLTLQEDTAKDKAYALAGGIQAVGDAMGTQYDSIEAYARAQGLSEDQTKDLVKQVSDWGSALAAFVQPLEAYTGLLDKKKQAEQDAAQKTADSTKSTKDSWEDYAKPVGVSVDEYIGQLQKQVDAQKTWQGNMTQLAGRVSQDTLDQLARMGPEGAPLVAELVHASDAQLAQLEPLFQQHTADATGAMAGELYLAQVLLPQIASKVGQDTATALALSLANGTTTIAQIASQYAGVLASGINPVLVSLGKAQISSNLGSSLASKLDSTNGPHRTVAANADGNLYERHDAQIAPAGAMRLWAEPETGGEAYIPLAESKSQRSRGIWEQVGRMKGWGPTADLLQFAPGGFFNVGSVPRPPSTAPFQAPLSTSAAGTMDYGYRAASGWVEQQQGPLAGLYGSDEGVAAGGPGGPGIPGFGSDQIKAFLHSVDPKPYIWGAVGPGGYDCSGLAGQVWAMVTGRPQFRRYFTTGSIGDGRGYGFEPGLGGMLDLGFNSHHVVGSYGGLGFEAESTKTGIKVGAAATSPASMPKRMHIGTRPVMGSLDSKLNQYADGSILRPYVRDSGGPLMPGYTYNGTGRPEAVEWVRGPGQSSSSSSTSSSRKVEVLVRATTDDTVAHAVSGAISKDLRNQAVVNGFRL